MDIVMPNGESIFKTGGSFEKEFGKLFGDPTLSKSTTQSKPLTHRNKRNMNSEIPLNNNFFSKTNIVHFNYNKPPPCNSNSNNKVLQTFTHFKSASSRIKPNAMKNTPLKRVCTGLHYCITS